VNPPALPPKKDVILALLERTSVFIHLDPRHPEVRVPPWFKNQPQLVLQVGLNLAVRIPDLDVGDDAVSCTLSFNRSPFFCYVPWTAVFGLVGEDGKGMLWPKDIPPEVAAQQADRAQKEKAEKAGKDAPRMRAVAPVPSAPAAAQKDASTDAPATPGRTQKGTPTAGATPKSPSKKREPARLRAEKAAPEGEAAASGRNKGERSEPSDKKGESKRPLPPYLRVVK
jgi:stringent starvation protein B